MAQEKGMTLALPDETTFRHEIEAVNRFQQIVHANLVKDQDYGIIPGTQKPTLLKPGAEKIVKLLGLADHYVIVDHKEDWDKPFFRYLIKCSLVNVLTDTTTSEGLGECNSYESKYRWRWVGERDLPAGIDKTKLVTQERRSKTGGYWTMYRLENEDIFSQVNTILKMAKKRALVDAALSAGRLSNLFTQDIEDIIPSPAQEVTTITFPKPKQTASSTPDNATKQGIEPEADSNTTATEQGAVTAEKDEEKGKPEKPARDLSKLKSTGDLKVALYKDFGVREGQQLKELNIEHWVDLAISLPEAYRTIAVTRLK